MEESKTGFNFKISLAFGAITTLSMSAGDYFPTVKDEPSARLTLLKVYLGAALVTFEPSWTFKVPITFLSEVLCRMKSVESLVAEAAIPFERFKVPPFKTSKLYKSGRLRFLKMALPPDLIVTFLTFTSEEGIIF